MKLFSVVVVSALSLSLQIPPADAIPAATPSCRSLPGDAAWPSITAWSALNSTIGGRLIATVPQGSPCHAPNFNSEQCESLAEQWDYPWIHSQDPSAIDMPWFQNGTCDPFHPIETPCTLGNLVSYSINVSSATDVIAGLKFARQNNVRIAIKNTGHDFIGKSTAKGGLGLWTHNLNQIDILWNYTSRGYSGPAMKMGAGTQAYLAYEAAHQFGYRVIGGTCPTVGLAGGYTQGGGHSALSSLYGMSADHVLEWEVVTPDGQHIVTSPEKHADLHWAISGGGPGTFGVVISMTTKMFKDGTTNGASLSFNTTSAPGSTFWSAIEEFQSHIGPLVDSGSVALYSITSTTFFAYIAAPTINTTQISSYLQPTTSLLSSLNATFSLSITTDPSYFDYFSRYFGPLPAGVWDSSHLISSRLIPRSVVQANNSIVASAFQNITASGIWSLSAVALNVSHTVAGNVPGSNAVLPAWRSALLHTIVYSPWNWTVPQSVMVERENYLTNTISPLLESFTPGSGTYLNEANFEQIAWHEQFYGANWDRLSDVKKKYDPEGLLYARTAVGSEAWEEGEGGRICRI